MAETKNKEAKGASKGPVHKVDPGSHFPFFEDEKFGRVSDHETSANPLSRLFFSWFTPLITLGASKPLEEEDLWYLEKRDNATNVNQRFNAAIANSRVKIGRVSLFNAIWATQGNTILFAGVLKLIQDLFQFAGPLLLEQIVNFLVDFQDGKPVTVEDGLFWVAVIFGTSVLQSWTQNHYFATMARVGVQTKVGLTLAMYKQGLTMDNAERAKVTTGKIVNLMSADATRLEQFFFFFHMLWSGPMQIIIALYLINSRLGAATWAGVGVMILTMPLQAWSAAKGTRLNKEALGFADKRIKFMGELLNGIRVIKFYAWEENFAKMVGEVRAKELAKYKSIAYIGAFLGFIIVSVPTIVSAATFSIYALLGGELTPATVFSSLALFNILRFPLSFLPMILMSAVNAWTSVKRMQEILDKPLMADRTTSTLPPTSDTAVRVKHGNFAWEADKLSNGTPTLRKIDLNLAKGKLHMVIGEVGSGKSSLIAAILGEMNRDATTDVAVNGSTSYVAQSAWILNATVRDNILFGTDYDDTRYEEVLRSCALLPDLEVLADGDDTEIGERGINLSGGQKQRISIARAAYSRTDIVLMDDSLSAVDAHVGKHIIEEAVTGSIMKDRTRILATNQLQFLPLADNIIVMGKGRITHQGTYAELEAQGFDFHTVKGDDDDEAPAVPPKPTLDGAEEKDLKAAAAVVAGEAEKKLGVVPPPPPTPGRTHHHGKVAKDEKTAALTGKEHRDIGKVSSGVYSHYFRNLAPKWMGKTLFWIVILVFFYILADLVRVSVDVWLAFWSEDRFELPLATYLWVYAGLGVATALATANRTYAMAWSGINAARRLHDELFANVLRLPTSFFDKTPIGRVLNRFSKDLEDLDTKIYLTLNQFIGIVLITFSTFLVIIASNPITAAVFVVLGGGYYYIQGYYRRTSRELKRLDAVSRSPVYAHFSESLAGHATVRAYGQMERFMKDNERFVSRNVRAAWPYLLSNRWLAIRLEFIGALIVTTVCLFNVLAYETIDPGLAGLTIGYALGVTGLLNFVIRLSVDVESNMNAVERQKEYASEPTEAALVTDVRPPTEWPSQGAVSFKGVELRYREDLPLVLRGLSAEVKPGEKIGIVGRTGAGKSSLMSALFRLVELAGGSVVIDGVDISKIGLRDLRSKIGIVTQDNFLFSGTVRRNLDPFSEHTDAEIWDALGRVRCREAIGELEGKLEGLVAEDGSNFSAGQKQELCLARALLRGSKILVLDEATSAVDFETDAVIQDTIRSQFKDATVLTIAHRLNTIMDSDRVMVLDAGQIAEFDTPLALVDKEDGVFAGMVASTGRSNAKYLRLIAEGKISVTTKLEDISPLLSRSPSPGRSPRAGGSPTKEIPPVPPTPPQPSDGDEGES